MPPRRPAGTAARFDAKEPTVYRDLQSSMRHLGASSVRVTGRNLMDESDVAAEISFDRSGKRYVVRCRKWKRWLDNFRSAERTIFYLYRAIAEYGAETNEKTFGQAVETMLAGFEALPDDLVLALPSGNKEWWEVLGVQADADVPAIRSAYRALARVHHPDAGGDADSFTALRRAYGDALKAKGVAS